jgi:hypothetical protein
VPFAALKKSRAPAGELTSIVVVVEEDSKCFYLPILTVSVESNYCFDNILGTFSFWYALEDVPALLERQVELQLQP